MHISVYWNAWGKMTPVFSKHSVSFSPLLGCSVGLANKLLCGSGDQINYLSFILWEQKTRHVNYSLCSQYGFSEVSLETDPSVCHYSCGS